MIKDRIIQIADFYGVSKEKFFKKIGTTSANFRGNARKTPVNSQIIENLFTTFPQISLDWLITGNGTMICDTFKPKELPIEDKQAVDEIQQMMERISELKYTIEAMRVFFQWAVEHLYCKENPFTAIKTLRNESKIRILIDERSRSKIRDYYAEKSPMMNLVCNLVYSSAIRPIEILRIKLGDIDVANHYIRIPAENAKNHKERFATITKDIVDMLLPVAMRYSDVNLYLIGKNKDLLPDTEPLNESHFQKSWDRMRKALGLPSEMQLYSLRDTGLTDLLHAGVDQLTVRQHADHSSLAMQDVYTNHYDKELNETIFENAPKF